MLAAGNNLYLIADGPHRQNSIQHRIRPDLQHDSVPQIGLEAPSCDLQLVWANGKTREKKAALSRSLHLAYEARIGLGDSYLGSRNCSAGGILNRPCDLRSGDCLAKGQRAKNSCRQK